MKILITGGTGWLGKKLVAEYVNRGYDVTILSRNEYNQWRLKQKHPEIKCILHDIRRPLEIKAYYDVIIHTAALKHVSTGIEFPDEVIDTNVNGTRNVAHFAYTNAKHLIYISTDKAVDPANWYGQTKEKGEDITWECPCSTVIRFGNLFGSSGSIIEIMARKALMNDNNFQLSDKNSERFFLTYQDAIKLIDKAMREKPRLLIGDYKALKIVDLVNYVFEGANISFIGLRNGEKLKEQLYDIEYSYYTEAEVHEIFKNYFDEYVGERLL
jgi:UDP-N-acetylglucosamine 4,6-dehydratase/5-epimerase